MVSLQDILNSVNDINSDAIFTMPIYEFCSQSSFIDWRAIHEDKNIMEAIELLGFLHRILVINDEGKPYNIISQMDIISFLAKNPGFLPEKLRKTPAGYIMTTSPMSVKKTDKVFDAFKTCLKMKYSGIGVVDENGKLEGNLSISSLKFLTAENFKSFLKITVQKFLEETGGSLLKLPKICEYHDDFEKIIKILNNNHVHRIYVFQNDKLVGVISTTDAMGFIAKELK